MTQLHVVSSGSVSDQSEAVKLAAQFSYECGLNLLPWMNRQFAQLLQEGFEPELLKEVISRTSRAPRPSWAYLSAILDNCRIRRAYDLASFLVMKRVQPWEKELPL